MLKNGCKHTFHITHVRISPNVKHLLYQEICACELCEKCVYNHSETTDLLKISLLFKKFTNFFFFFSIQVFFHEHSRFTGQQGKGEGIYLTPLYHFHPLHRHLDISRAIAAGSSPLHIAGRRTRTGNLWFPSASR